MGMDVYGKAPTSVAGEYFRNNVWWWRPLADFVTTEHADLTSACHYWHSNDGDGLDGAASAALGLALEADLASGRVKEYADAYTARLAALPLEPCTYCDSTGVRTDAVGKQLGLDVPRDPETGRGGCNACSGTGHLQSGECSYPFGVENVAEFARFLKACGGFSIC